LGRLDRPHILLRKSESFNLPNSQSNHAARITIMSSVSTEVEKRFKKAVWLVRNGPPNPNAGTEEKLKFYSLYKQATEGDCSIPQPWAVQMEARAKWDAWNELKGMSKEEAMAKYIELVAAGDPSWESHEALKDYKEDA
jgi:diazepam-binding inhibitor (GABA receptor modulating acyl-CoA-binding protein)